MKILHIHAQPAWHEEAHVVGNREALLALAKALTEAAETGAAVVTAFAADGEGYTVVVERLEDDAAWTAAELPYTSDDAAHGGKMPWDRMGLDAYRVLVLSTVPDGMATP